MAIDLNKPYTSQDFAESLFPPKPQTPLFPTAPIRLDQLSAPVQEDADLYEMFKPDMRAQDEYYKMLENAPKRENPSFTRKLLAGLGTLSPNPQNNSIEQAEKYKYAPYYREMEEYNRKSGILRELSASERASNINQRQLLTTALADRRAERKQAELERANREKEAHNNRMALVREQLARNPNYTVEFGTDGEMILIDRKTPGGAPIRTGIKGQSMSDLERLILTNAGQGARDALNNEARLELERMRQAHDKSMADLKAQIEAKQDKEKPLTPEQEKVRLYNIAQQVYNTDPTVRRYLTLGEPGTNTFQIRLPNTIPEWTGYGAEARRDNAKKWIEINQKIYGANFPIPADIKKAADWTPAPTTQSQRSQGTPTQKTGQATRPANVPATFIKITDKASGKTGWIDPKEFDATKHVKVQ